VGILEIIIQDPVSYFLQSAAFPMSCRLLLLALMLVVSVYGAKEKDASDCEVSQTTWLKAGV